MGWELIGHKVLKSEMSGERWQAAPLSIIKGKVLEGLEEKGGKEEGRIGAEKAFNEHE